MTSHFPLMSSNTIIMRQRSSVGREDSEISYLVQGSRRGVSSSAKSRSMLADLSCLCNVISFSKNLTVKFFHPFSSNSDVKTSLPTPNTKCSFNSFISNSDLRLSVSPPQPVQYQLFPCFRPPISAFAPPSGAFSFKLQPFCCMYHTIGDEIFLSTWCWIFFPEIRELCFRLLRRNSALLSLIISFLSWLGL